MLAWLVAFVLWLASVQGVNLRAMNDYGLVSVLPATYFIALGLLTVSACFQLRFGSSNWVWLLHLALLIVIIHGTPTALYEFLRYSWAWKHIGIIDYLQRHGTVDPTIRFLSVYHNWPGFFTLSLFLTEAAGLGTSLAYASLAPVFFNLVYAGPLWMIYRAFSNDQRLVRLGLWVFFCASWVGQDYFAPQALAMFLYLLMLAMVLWFLRDEHAFGRLPLAGWPVIRQATRIIDRRLPPLQPSPAWSSSTRRQRVGAAIIIMVCVSAIAVSHPLTPVFIGLSLFILAALKQMRMRWLLILAVAVIVVWNVTGARAFVGDAIGDVLSDFGNVKGKIALQSLGTVSAGQQFVSMAGRVLTGLVLLMGLLGMARRRWAGQRDVAALGLALAPLVMPLLNSYGGEMIFRAYLFSLPFMAFFVAGVVFPKQGALQNWAGVALPAGLSAVLLFCLMFSYYGKERQYFFTRGEVAAANFIYETAPHNTLLIEGSRNYPSQFRNYERFVYVPLSREAMDDRREVIQDAAGVLARWMSDERFPAAFVIFTRSQRAMDESLGVFPVGALTLIEEEMKASGKFKAVFQNEDASVYVLAARQRGGNNP
jgi:hypothetical protein